MAFVPQPGLKRQQPSLRDWWRQLSGLRKTLVGTALVAVVALAVAGAYQASTAVVAFFTKPDPASATLLRVITDPAVPSQVLVDGVARDTWGLTWLKLPPGNYEVSFTDVPGFTTPAAQVVTVAEGATTETMGVMSARGWLRVTTDPAVPATISVDGVPRNDWGMWTDMPAGTYEVCFGEVADFATSLCQPAEVTPGATTVITGSFVAGGGPLPTSTDGFLRVTTSPAVPSQVLVDGVARDTWGLTWLKLPPGSYEVSFTDVPGFATPAPQVVTVAEGATTEWTGSFAARGWLRVTTDPALPATISVDSVPRNDWGMWTDLPAGTYEVCFGEVADFTAPPCQTATVTAGALTTIVGAFG